VVLENILKKTEDVIEDVVVKAAGKAGDLQPQVAEVAGDVKVGAMAAGAGIVDAGGEIFDKVKSAVGAARTEEAAARMDLVGKAKEVLTDERVHQVAQGVKGFTPDAVDGLVDKAAAVLKRVND
jgi:hypothetical protein